MSGYVSSGIDQFKNEYWVLGFCGTIEEIVELEKHLRPLNGVMVSSVDLRLLSNNRTEYHIEVTTFDPNLAMLLKLTYQN